MLPPNLCVSIENIFKEILNVALIAPIISPSLPSLGTDSLQAKIILLPPAAHICWEATKENVVGREGDCYPLLVINRVHILPPIYLKVILLPAINLRQARS